ncbi:MAG: hypothetical protein OXU20_24500 [Myxococcales bacterium]|nr:hypothetical protein [Myxococcales bacterium]
MSRDRSDAMPVWFPVLILVALGLAIYKAVLWVIEGVASAWHFALHALELAGLIFFGILGVLFVVSVLEAIVAALVRMRKRRSAVARCPLPSYSAVQGRPRSGVDAFFASVFDGAIRERYARSASSLSERQLTSLRASLLPGALREADNIHAIETTIFTALYAELSAGNQKLDEWVERCAIAGRRRRFGWLCMRFLSCLPFVRGWSPGECWTSTSPEELKTDPEKFNKLMWTHAFPAMTFVEEVLAERVPLAAAAAVVPASVAEASPAPVISAPAPEPQAEPARLPAGVPEVPEVRAHPCERDEPRDGDEQARHRERAAEAVEAVAQQLEEHAWLDDPERVLGDLDEALALAAPHHPTPDLVHELGAQVRGMRDRLPGFRRAFADELDRDPGEMSPWILAALSEAETTHSLACTAADVERIACRIYLTSDPEIVSDRVQRGGCEPEPIEREEVVTPSAQSRAQAINEHHDAVRVDDSLELGF